MKEIMKREKTGGKGNPASDFEVAGDLRLLSDVELERMGLEKARTRRNLRSLGRDPIPYVRVGPKLIRYRLKDVLDYIERNRVV